MASSLEVFSPDVRHASTSLTRTTKNFDPDLVYAICARIYLESTRFKAYMRAADREKFVRLANKRVSTALKAIQLIGNLSNKSNYDYTEADVLKIFRALQDEVSSSRRSSTWPNIGKERAWNLIWTNAGPRNGEPKLIMKSKDTCFRLLMAESEKEVQELVDATPQ